MVRYPLSFMIANGSEIELVSAAAGPSDHGRVLIRPLQKSAKIFCTASMESGVSHSFIASSRCESQ